MDTRTSRRFEVGESNKVRRSLCFEKERATSNLGRSSMVAHAININELKGKSCVEEKWSLSLYAKILGDQKPLRAVIDKAKEWNIEIKVDIQLIATDFFLITFTLASDYSRVIKEGPWMVNGKYLVLVPWKPDFNPIRAKLKEADVWVHLLGLPIDLWSRDDLEIILRDVGKVLKLDDDTIKLSHTISSSLY
uniref:DUF4283 domain-containing protein n=1 Tax=Nelumbo nucifera TaxID=4432 RepID=A0A822YMV0_NELNU|nr:TPA_asm: hypothetical protein HUJ06_011480 [Nelumbo nucifera]